MTFELKYGMKKQRRRSSNFLFLVAPGSLQTSAVAEGAGDWGTFGMIFSISIVSNIHTRILIVPSSFRQRPRGKSSDI